MKKLIALFVSVSIMLTVALTPASAFEDTDYLNPLVDEGTSFEVLENEISAVQGGYTYNPPDSGSFLIENVNGTVTIVDETILLCYSGNTLILPTVDYYKIVDNKGNLRYYQADVLADPAQSGNFVYIALYIENCTGYSLNVQYMVESGTKMYNIVAPLSVEQYAYFDQISTQFCLHADDVSNRLKLSARAHKYGVYSQDTELMMNDSTEPVYNSIAPMALNSIAENSFDLYTNDDGIIRSYVEDYFMDCYTGDGYNYKDDPIVDIVPKQLFFVEGEHIYVGKEYGFFVRVVEDPYQISGYTADVMVFDIIHTTPDFNTSEVGSSRVEPLFQFMYVAATERSRYPFDSNLTSAVFPHLQFDSVEYFLEDIGFMFTLQNVDSLNPGDSGYDPYEDDGAFFIHLWADANGVGLKKKEGNFADDLVKFGLGCIPGDGAIIGGVIFVWDTIQGFNGGQYTYYRDKIESNGNQNLHKIKTNNTDQIDEYGFLVKSLPAAFTNQDAEKPLLIHVGGGYVEACYKIGRKSGSENNKIRVITSVSVSVIEDNTYKDFFGEEKGEIVECGRATGTYETGKYSRLNDITPRGMVNVTIPEGTQRHIIKMTPMVSGSYKIITSGKSGDPHFYITNATRNTSTIAATDDISLNDKNAELVIELIAGDVYYIETFNYSRSSSHTLRIGCNPVSNETITESAPYFVSVPAGTYDIVKFIPTESGYYQICTNRIWGDPLLYVFLSSGGLWGSDNNSGGNYNAHIDVYLTAGVTYYIVVHEYNGFAFDGSISVTPRD